MGEKTPSARRKSNGTPIAAAKRRPRRFFNGSRHVEIGKMIAKSRGGQYDNGVAWGVGVRWKRSCTKPKKKSNSDPAESLVGDREIDAV